MKQVLLSTASLAQDWLAEELMPVLNQTSRVLVLTCIQEEFRIVGDSLESYTQKEIARSLRYYGVEKDQMVFCRLIHKNQEKIQAFLKIVNVVIFVGNNPSLAYQRLEEYGLLGSLQQFQGELVLIGPMAYLFLEENPYSPRTLARIHGFDLILNYVEQEQTLKEIIDLLEEKGQSVIAFTAHSGVSIESEEISPLGEAYLFQPSQLDELYQAYATYFKS